MRISDWSSDVCSSDLGQKIDGPAIVREATATTVVEPGWQAELTTRGHLVLTRVVPRPKSEAIGTEADPVMLEVFNNLYMSIAEQMGATLANTAYRSEEHTSELHSLLRNSSAVFCLKHK